MAQFGPSDQITKTGEGYYAWFYGDGGGETYAGVTRNYNPTWSGWAVVDDYKKKMGVVGTNPLNTFKNNTMIPGMGPHVNAYYQAWWNRLGLSNIKNQDVANIVWDFIVNSQYAGIKTVEQVLQNVLKANIKADTKWDQQSIDAINAQDPGKLFKAILDERKSYYDRIANYLHDYTVQAGETAASIAKKFRLSLTDVPSAVMAWQVLKLKTNLQFRQGWLQRLKKFEGINPLVAGGSLVGIAILIGLFFLVRNRNKKKKQLNGKPKLAKKKIRKTAI